MPGKQPAAADHSMATGGHFLYPTAEYLLWWQKWRKLNLCRVATASMMYH